MSIECKVRYVLSALGLLAATVSILIVFAVPIFAACNASVTCPGGGEISCSCPGQGVCNSGPNYVQCLCQGQDPMEPACCGGTCS